jgi:flagellar hook-associated protein 2
MAGIQLSGLASGLDTEGMITQLMAIERRPRTRIEFKQAAVQARQDALGDIVGKLRTLKLAAADLKSPLLWSEKQSVTVADQTRLDARRLSTAAAGTYDVTVDRLATATQRTFTYTAPSGASSLSFNGVDVALAGGATLDDAVTAINAATSTGVTAASVSGKLVVTSQATGQATNFSWGGPALALDSELLGQDSSVTLNGTAYTSSTNVNTTAIAGLELNLKATGATKVEVGPAAVDKDAIAKKVKAFVDAHNAVSEAIRSRTGEKRVNDPKTVLDAKKGVLFGDRGLGQALSALRQAASDPVAGNPSSLDELGELGISTGAVSDAINPDAVAGRLVLDDAKLRAMLDSDLAGAQRLLGGKTDTPGIAQRFETIIDPLTGKGTGLEARASSAGDEMVRLRTSLTRFDERLERREERLRKQFSAMEQALRANQARQAEMQLRFGLPSA